MRDINKRKMVVSLVIGVLSLTILIIGASFAYFNVNTNITTTETNGVLTAQGLGNVYLDGTSADLSLALTNEALMLSNSGSYFYGSEDGTPSDEVYLAEVGTAVVDGGYTYDCTYELSITASGDLQSAFKRLDSAYYEQLAIVIVSGADEEEAMANLEAEWNSFETDENTGNEVYTGDYLLYDEDEDYYYVPGDFYGDDFPITIVGHLNGITEDNSKSIYAYLYYYNSEDDHTELSGTLESITINVTDFACEKATPPAALPTITLTIDNDDPITIAEEDFSLVRNNGESVDRIYTSTLETASNASTTYAKKCTYVYGLSVDGTFVDLYDSLSILNDNNVYFGVNVPDTFIVFDDAFDDVSLDDIISAGGEYEQTINFNIPKKQGYLMNNKKLIANIYIPNLETFRETYTGTTLNLYIRKISGTCTTYDGGSVSQ
jgi:hypothetical protein